MHPQVPWKLVADPLGSVEHTLAAITVKPGTRLHGVISQKTSTSGYCCGKLV
jgi:hypothetical protein